MTPLQDKTNFGGPKVAQHSWYLAVVFLGLCQALMGGLTGLLSFQCSLQLQAVHVLLHPPGIRVCTDLPFLPGDEHNCWLGALAAGVEILLHMTLGQLS